jgi:hypothetical protein
MCGPKTINPIRKMQLELIIKLLDFNWLIIIRPANVPMQNKIITGVRLLLNNKSDAKPLTKEPKKPPISKKDNAEFADIRENPWSCRYTFPQSFIAVRIT